MKRVYENNPFSIFFRTWREKKRKEERERKREGNNFKTASCNREAIIGQITSIDKFTQKDLKTLKLVKASSSKFDRVIPIYPLILRYVLSIIKYTR